MNNEPAKSIITYLGGASVVAEIVQKHISNVYRWTYPESAREGFGGLIPAKDQRRLLEHCEQHSIDLRPGDFFDPSRLQSLLSERAEREAAE